MRPLKCNSIAGRLRFTERHTAERWYFELLPNAGDKCDKSLFGLTLIFTCERDKRQYDRVKKLIQEYKRSGAITEVDVDEYICRHR